MFLAARGRRGGTNAGVFEVSRGRASWATNVAAVRPEVEARTAAHPLDTAWVRSVAWSVAAAAGSVVLLRLVLPRDVPVGILAYGMVIGCINALIAVGLIVVHRSHRIINFAHAEVGIFGAILFENLVRDLRFPWLVAVVVGTGASAALAAGMEYGLVRRFAAAPRLILTVVTIGIAQVVVVLTYVLSRAFGNVAAGAGVETLFSGLSLTITGVVFSGDAVLLVVVTPIVVGCLSVFLRRTDIGVAVRASAEGAERAALLGIPVRRVGTVMWAVAGAMVGLATILRSPVVGLVSGSTVQGPGLLLRALTVAVLARMDDLRVAIGAALLLGVLEQAVFFAYNGSSVTDPIFVAVTIGALLLQRRSTSRVDEGTGTLALVEDVRPVPRELRSVLIVRHARALVLSALGVGLVVLGLTVSPSRANLLAVVAIYAMVAVSLVVLTGWAGQISLGQFGIAGIGGGVTARLVADGQVDFFFALAGGAVAGAAAALVLGLAALKLRGFYFAVTSLGFAISVETYFLNSRFFDLLSPAARPERPVLFGRWDLESERGYYLVSIAVLALVVGAVSRLRRSRTGRTLVAVRDNERAAQSFGISQARAKLLAFAISGAIAGLAGGLLVVHQHAVSATGFAASQSISVFSMAVIGGLGSLPGAVLGAIYVRGASFFLEDQWSVLATGIGLLGVLLVLPRGLGGVIFDLRDRSLRSIARRRGILVPSLLADAAKPDSDDQVPPSHEPCDVQLAVGQ